MTEQITLELTPEQVKVLATACLYAALNLEPGIDISPERYDHTKARLIEIYTQAILAERHITPTSPARARRLGKAQTDA